MYSFRKTKMCWCLLVVLNMSYSSDLIIGASNTCSVCPSLRLSVQASPGGAPPTDNSGPGASVGAVGRVAPQASSPTLTKRDTTWRVFSLPSSYSSSLFIQFYSSLLGSGRSQGFTRGSLTSYTDWGLGSRFVRFEIVWLRRHGGPSSPSRPRH